MYTHDEVPPLPAAGFGRILGYVVAAATGALALCCLVTGGGVVAALVLGAFAASLAVAITDTSPLLRGLAAVVAIVSGVVSLGFLTLMLVFLTGDF